MTAEEIQRRIRYLKGQITALQGKNATLKRNITELEEGDADAASLVYKWEKTLSDCFDVVKNKLSNVDEGSEFQSYYLERIDEILSSKEANEIGECLGSIKGDTRRKIDEFEGEIKANNARIYRYQAELDELRAIQVNGVE